MAQPAGFARRAKYLTEWAPSDISPLRFSITTNKMRFNVLRMSVILAIIESDTHARKKLR